MRTGVIGLLFALPVLYGGCEWWQGRPVKHSPGVLVSAEPLQTDVSNVSPLEKSGYQLKPLARYEIRARVLSTESYKWDEGASLVPVDVAVGWGPMSDTAVLDEFEIWQSGRWYQWRTKSMPIPQEEVTNHSANMHLIAADKYVSRTVAKLRSGQVVTMKGYLVEAKRKDGFTWTSSLTRTDSGNGACELMWVSDISVE